MSLKARIHSNEPLSDSEAAQVQLLLADTLNRLDDLERERSRCSLPESLMKLENERRDRSRYAVILKGALSVIRQIPAEILADIFLHCRDNDVDAGKYFVANPRVAPMLLTHVSSRWRQVSHGTPRLWDRFYLPTTKDPLVNLPLVEQILERSSALPLHVRLGQDSDFWLTRDTDAGAFGVVFQQNIRIAQLQFRMRSVTFPQHAFEHGKPFHCLTSLRLELPPFFDVASILSLFTNAPRLQLLEVIAKGRLGSSLIPVLPWSQLTYIKLDLPVDFVHVRRILAQCKSVEQCDLGELTEGDEDFAPLQCICQLDRLEQFTFTSDAAVPEAFLGGFSFPSLLHLTIISAGLALNTLPNLHHHSQFNLTHLRLHCVNLYGEELLQFLYHLSTFQVLELEWCCVDESLFEAFTYSLVTFTPLLVLPQLRVLKIGNEVTTDLDGLLLAAMLESICTHSGGRNLAFPVLGEVHLYLEGPLFSAEVEDRLAAVCATSVVVDHVQRSRA
ncbi:hypothetical protein B0H15DRAFT_868815 [Mycena belliarum]|uniref:F-box domain-containing protein n=1 Tax=Mycena belliarum TaxID=1033014 RepID=A0AAD6TTC9_9AGAR|nr:hypothetical protein B0H15DRAFT_868815 [Mycena belliae]